MGPASGMAGTTSTGRAAGGSGASGGPAAASGGTGSVALVGPLGTATFTDLGETVEVSIAITACTIGKNYPIHIHDGSSCTDSMSQGPHWDPPRGEGIPGIACLNSIGTIAHHRNLQDAKPWTVGPPAESNVIGRVIVLHDPDDPMKRIACGKIETPP